EQPLARALAAEGLHVVTLDLLGHGRSDRPADPLVYSMTAFGEQVIALLDHPLEAGLVAFGPMMLCARYLPFTVAGLRALTRPIPRGLVPFWVGIALDTLDQQPAAMAATLHGIIFGRIAPPSRVRRSITAPALVVGHPKDPIHPAADAAMLAE